MSDQKSDAFLLFKGVEGLKRAEVIEYVKANITTKPGKN